MKTYFIYIQESRLADDSYEEGFIHKWIPPVLYTTVNGVKAFRKFYDALPWHEKYCFSDRIKSGIFRTNYHKILSKKIMNLPFDYETSFFIMDEDGNLRTKKELLSYTKKNRQPSHKKVYQYKKWPAFSKKEGKMPDEIKEIKDTYGFVIKGYGKRPLTYKEIRWSDNSSKCWKDQSKRKRQMKKIVS